MFLLSMRVCVEGIECAVVGDILSPTHLLLLTVVALLVFGPRRLPEIGSGLGRGILEFRRALSGLLHPSEHSLTDGNDMHNPSSSAAASVNLAQDTVNAEVPHGD